ncbi:MAG: LapA family protein [Deltaproteobacteria bacterium]|nr:LapA family protein [Deltaproteobacteria bacterium]
MKSAKLVLLAVVGVFLVLAVVQNLSLFTHRESLRLNLLVWKYETAPILLSMYFVGFFLIGLLLSYFAGLSDRFKAKNEIKNHLKRISKLEEEIKVLKSLPVQEESSPSQETETVQPS